jgi:transposase-like protein
LCPHTACDYRGWLGLNNLRAHGHPSGGSWRQLHCLGCSGFFPEHHGTIFHGKQAEVELMVRVLACLAEGLGIRATARGFEVDPKTVLHWLVDATAQLKAFSSYFRCEVHVQQVQLDELSAVLSAVKDGQMREEEAIRRLARSPQWVWTAIDPQSKLLLAITVGPRTQAMAQRVVHQVMEVLAPGCLPLFITDGFKEYMSALVSHFGSWVQPPRRQATGPAPAPRWMPLPVAADAPVSGTLR